MGQAQHTPMTTAEFLDWEARQEQRWEFDGIQPVAMTGGTYVHGRIVGRLITALNNRLQGKPCEPNGPDVRLPTTYGHYRYPDVFVTCKPPAPDATEVTEPVVIFEVLSTSTADVDRTEKLTEYCAIPSVQRYVMLEQSRAFATSINRMETGWGIQVLDATGTLDLPEIGISIPLAALYEGLELTRPDTAP